MFPDITQVKVELNKKIPMQAGLGGGSADCATFIMCMNELFELGMNIIQMQDIGVKLGADVPASFYNKPIIAKGIGELIQEIGSDFKFYIVIIKPELSCDTKKMYEKLDNTNYISQKYNSDIIRCAIENEDIEILSKNLYNVFENSVYDIDKIKQELIDSGASNALMSGSGSCVYGIFRNKNEAKRAYRYLKQKYETYFCITK